MKNEERRSRTVVLSVLCVPFLLVPAVAPALEMDKLKVQRKEVFEFTEKPKVTREGDKITIAFAVKDFCDATVAIEDENPSAGSGQAGKIVRHLASGVLGKNAPLPFQKDSLKQTVVWDGKDEIGRYVDDKDSHTVRVSLGLKPQFERTLYWSPKRVASGCMSAAPEGVYVFLGGHGPQLVLFDHAGDYVRTIYPFPTEKMGRSPDECRIKGVDWIAYPPDGEKLPSKLIGHDQDTLLPDAGVRAIAVAGSRIAMAADRALFLATDGSSGGMNLGGPVVSYPVAAGPGEETSIWPASMALSPDGKRLYLTAYNRVSSGNGYGARTILHGVNMVNLDGSTNLVPFAGVMKAGAEGYGSGNDRFRAPLGVACDAQGRVYVADNLNNRIQVFAPDGKFLKTIPTPRPGVVQIHPKNGEIWVVTSGLSCSVLNGQLGVDPATLGCATVLRILNSLDDPQERAAYPLPEHAHDYYRFMYLHNARVAVDFHTEPPTLWTSFSTSVGDRSPEAIQLHQIADRKVVLKRSFISDTQKVLAQPRPPKFGRPRLWFNPANEKLYLGQITPGTAVSCKSFYDAVKIDPKTGKSVEVHLPTNAEDMGFDWEGRAYLRGHDWVARFDSETWREIPYDYGDERMVYFDDGGPKPHKSSAALIMPGSMGCFFHQGGFGVAPDGTIVAGCINPNNAEMKKRMAEKNIHAAKGANPYTPPIYPGRNAGWETHVFDVHGKLVQADVAPGIGYSNFLQIDRDRNVYVLAASTPYLDGKPYFNGRGCTLLKLVPGKMKCLTPGGIIPLAQAAQPKRPMDMTRPDIWVEGAEWLFGPVGADGHYGSGGKCDCYVHAVFSLDYFGRSFAPEVDRYRAVVLDSNGNVIVRIGKYGNVDDGTPLVKPDPALADKQGAQPPAPRSIGGDEVAIMHAMNVAVHSDRRFFLADIGNQCIRSVKLGYHAEEKVALKDVKDVKK